MYDKEGYVHGQSGVQGNFRYLSLLMLISEKSFMLIYWESIPFSLGT